MATVLTAALGAFLASAAFSILYNLQSRPLILVAGLNGAFGTAVYQVVMNAGGAEPAASFFGAVAFTLFAWVAARIARRPIVTFTAPALIPLVPGGDVYRMMLAFLDGRIQEGWSWGLEALAVTGMLVLGMMVVSSVPYATHHLAKLRKGGRG